MSTTVAPAEETTPVLSKREGNKPAVAASRLVSLDAFRGMTIFVMVWVNLGAGYKFLQHSAWDGVTLADFVMPYFLFIVGTSIALSTTKLLERGASRWDLFKKAAVRSLKLFFLGVFLQGADFPNYDLSTLRVMGVLQRIAIDFFIVSTCVIFIPTIPVQKLDEFLDNKFGSSNSSAYERVEGQTYYGGESEEVVEEAPAATRRSKSVNDSAFSKTPLEILLRLFIGSKGILVVVIKYIGIWIACLCITAITIGLTFGILVPGCSSRGQVSTACNAAGLIDSYILTPAHMYQWPTCKKADPPCTNFDPEGLLTTFASTLSCFIGLYFGYILYQFKDHKTRLLHFVPLSLVMTLLGIILNFCGLPFNKNLFSYSYILFMAGTAGLLLSACYIIIDIPKTKIPEYIFMPFIVLGMNSIAIYAGSEFLPVILGEPTDGGWLYWKSQENNIVAVYYRYILLKIMPAELATTFVGLGWCAFWIVIAAIMYKKKYFVKI